MKNKVFLLCIILLLSSIAFGQGTWTRLKTPDSTNMRYGIHFSDKNNGWCVGVGPSIWRTTDGGETWSDTTLTGYNDFRSVFAVSEDIAVVAEDGNRILRTSNGGLDWDSVYTYSQSGQMKVFFQDENKGWVTGYSGLDGLLHSTIDGGENWSTNTVASNVTMGVYFLNDSIGWICGNSGMIRHTVDGGETWSTQTSNTSNNLYCVWFANDTLGWISGYNGIILKTTDGGNEWINTDNLNVHTHSIQFVNDTLGWAAGYSGYIYKSTDGGSSWSEDHKEGNIAFFRLYFIDGGTGWICGPNGYIMKYTDETWSIPPEISLSTSSINIGQVEINSSDSSTFVIYNTGDTTLYISSITSDDNNFTISDASGSVLPDDSLVVTVTFSPVSVGNDTAIVSILSNDSDEDSVTVTVYGEGIGIPEITLSDTEINIGDVAVDYSESSSFYIKNEGTADLIFSNICSNNEVFTLSNTPDTLAAGDSQFVYIEFSPVSLGYDSAVITIASNDSDEDTLTVKATGNGIALSVIAALPDTTASKGAVFYLPLSISNVQSIDSILSYQFKLGYNSTFIEFVDYDTSGTLSGNFSINYSTSISDTLILSAATTDYPIKSNGILLKLGFNFKEAFTFDDTACLNFADFIFNEGTPDDNTVNCMVMMDSCLYGDVSLNGEITAYDASLTLSYTIGEESLSDAAQTAADVSGNGTVTAYDAALILRYVVGIITEFPVGDEKFVPKTDLSQAELSVDYEYSDDGTVECLLVLNNAEDVFSSELDINFLNMELLSVEKAEAAKEYQIAQKNTGDNLKIALAGVEPLKTGGEIIRLKFRLLSGEPSFRLSKAVLNETGISVAGIDDKIIPRTFNLSQNYPNPFNPETTIKYELPEAANITLKIYNMLGQEVKTLVNSRQKAGYYIIKWNGTNNLGIKVSSGVYIYRIKAGNFIRSMKMVYLR